MVHIFLLLVVLVIGRCGLRSRPLQLVTRTVEVSGAFLVVEPGIAIGAYSSWTAVVARGPRGRVGGIVG